MIWLQKLCLKVVNKAKNDTGKQYSSPPPHSPLSALARSDAHTKKNIFYRIVELTKANKGLPFFNRVNERSKAIIWHVWKFCKDKIVRTHACASTVYGYLYVFYAWIELSVQKIVFNGFLCDSVEITSCVYTKIIIFLVSVNMGRRNIYLAALRPLLPILTLISKNNC